MSAAPPASSAGRWIDAALMAALSTLAAVYLSRWPHDLYLLDE